MTARLDAERLLAAATAETGLTDYGDPTLPERFAVAVEHLNASRDGRLRHRRGGSRYAGGC